MQDKGVTQRYRYVVTEWTDSLDYSGFVHGLRILGMFDDPDEAITCAITGIETFIRDTLDPKSGWKPIERDLQRERNSVPNEFNKVIFARAASRTSPNWGDHHERESAIVEVIEVPSDTAINQRLFNTDWPVLNDH